MIVRTEVTLQNFMPRQDKKKKCLKQLYSPSVCFFFSLLFLLFEDFFAFVCYWLFIYCFANPFELEKYCTGIHNYSHVKRKYISFCIFSDHSILTDYKEIFLNQYFMNDMNILPDSKTQLIRLGTLFVETFKILSLFLMYAQLESWAERN